MPVSNVSVERLEKYMHIPDEAPEVTGYFLPRS